MQKTMSEKNVELKEDYPIQSVIPEPTESDTEILSEILLQDKICYNPICVWHNIIVDGYRRYHICQAFSIPFTVIKLNFKSKQEAIIWRIDQHLGMRNANEYVRCMLAIKKAKILDQMQQQSFIS